MRKLLARIRPHLRFSLRTMVLGAVLIGFCMGLWSRWEPWYVEARIGNHNDVINTAAFSPDGNRIVTASDDNTAQIWSTSGTMLYTLKGHADDLFEAIYSPDGKSVLTASRDFTARLWDAETGKEKFMMQHDGTVNHIAFSPDGKTIATASRNNVFLWHGDTGEKSLHVSHGMESSHLCVDISFTPDANGILTTWNDLSIIIFDTKTGAKTVIREIIKITPSLIYQDSKSWCNRSQMSPDGQHITVVTKRDGIEIFDVKSTKKIDKRHRHGFELGGYSYDGKFVYMLNDAQLQSIMVYSSQNDERLGAISPQINEDNSDESVNCEQLWHLDQLPNTFFHYSRIKALCCGGRRVIISNNNLLFDTAPYSLALYCHRRPSQWWGVAWLYEFWCATFTGAALLWSVRKDRNQFNPQR